MWQERSSQRRRRQCPLQERRELCRRTYETPAELHRWKIDSVRHARLLGTGLNDESALELEKLLFDNVELKIVFVVTLESGRPRPDDVYKIQLVLNAIPIDTSERFGIIVNKIEPELQMLLQRNPDMKSNLIRAIAGCRSTGNLYISPMLPALVCVGDAICAPTGLDQFLNRVPVTKPRGLACLPLILPSHTEDGWKAKTVEQRKELLNKYKMLLQLEQRKIVHQHELELQEKKLELAEQRKCLQDMHGRYERDLHDLNLLVELLKRDNMELIEDHESEIAELSRKLGQARENLRTERRELIEGYELQLSEQECDLIALFEAELHKQREQLQVKLAEVILSI